MHTYIYIYVALGEARFYLLAACRRSAKASKPRRLEASKPQALCIYIEREKEKESDKYTYIYI